jgi:hypothetical protein
MSALVWMSLVIVLKCHQLMSCKQMPRFLGSRAPRARRSAQMRPWRANVASRPLCHSIMSEIGCGDSDELLNFRRGTTFFDS